ncbi:AAA domain-containing protein [Saccharomonospora azurea]|nr:AAA domain-containing protein [Saccharomonospora azurea]
MNNTMVERARNLFEFLQRAQELKTTAPRTTDRYQREGEVLWFADFPEHPAVQHANGLTSPASDSPLLTVDRIPRRTPPQPGTGLERWLLGRWDDPDRAPELRESLTIAVRDGAEGDQVTRQVRVTEYPHIREAYESWRAEWAAWAEEELRDRPARDFYNLLFSLFLKVKDSPEEVELVAGTACLSWRPEGHPEVSRHVFTSPLIVEFDDATGRLAVVVGDTPEAFKTELDMLDPGLIKATETVNEVRAAVRALHVHPLDREELGLFGRRLVHALDADGEYRDEDRPAAATEDATVTFAPALILRKRSQRGLVEVFQTLTGQLAGAETVPDGILPLLDPDQVPAVEPTTTGGALVTVDDESFLPMPVNERQREIIERVDRQAQVLVQGPPGTGKTHTAAALISHLLAQGKRVLVTAQTDRALREVRDKLPDQIKPLSVAVVGTSRDDMADLKVAVQEIAAAAHDHDTKRNAREIEGCLAEIDRLRRERAEVYRDLLAARESEVRQHDRGDYRGTLADIAKQIEDQEREYGWVLEHVPEGMADEPPLTGQEVLEWRQHLLDGELAADEPEARQQLVALDALPSPARFATFVTAERGAEARRREREELRHHPAFPAILRLDASQRDELRKRLGRIADEQTVLAGGPEQWIPAALADVCAGREAAWRAQAEQLAALIEQTAQHVQRLGALTEVELPDDDAARMVALAREVLRYLEEGHRVKTAADGTPKVGRLAPKVLKQAQPLFDSVKVDGLPPTNTGQLLAVVTWFEASKMLAALDRTWPGRGDSKTDPLHVRLQWHRTELGQLWRVLRLAEELRAEERRLAELGIPLPDWSDATALNTCQALCDTVEVEKAWAAAQEPLAVLTTTLAEIVGDDVAPVVRRLRAAVDERDADEYGVAHARLARLWAIREQASRRDDLGRRLASAVPGLFRAVAAAPEDATWTGRLERFESAWAWAATRSWVRTQESLDVNALQQRTGRIDDRIRRQVETLAARRAWDYAASPERLNGSARADLTQYAQLVQRAGKLTGKYAAVQRAGIRQAMERCRPSVPAWIMPIYRIAEQLRITPDMFDVVIVDEASQAGMEATFLQYLAPKIVVIGDDKQVSPSAVGVDQQQLRDLAGQYLAGDRYRESWQDPQRSLFDEAKMRYGGVITLTEHRRCVPEIIGFSNRIAYEPDNIRLIPVRQYGADRLDPVKAVYLPDGYQRGTTNKINPVEAEAIVDQIEKCLADPAYENRTFGVISLLGPAQARYIESKLLDRIGKEQWTARDLRCGDASDFQGSERDVVFLSMVAVPEEGRRLAALTADRYVQRYNVAVSRAKDQVWLYHSVERQALNNKEDMRFQLLDYCYGVIERGRSSDQRASDLVPEDERVPPFDSLFEQRVHNRIVTRGYTVVPQYESAGYRIDLVVVGGGDRLAVECDGDRWHGPEAFERDLARQRELERCGWSFFRVRESLFYVDPAGALDGLWKMLDDRDIRPVGELREPPCRAELESTTIENPELAGTFEQTGGESPPETKEGKDGTPESAWLGAHLGAATTTAENSDDTRHASEAVEHGEAEEVRTPEPLGDETVPYEEFSGVVPPVDTGLRADIIEGLRSIVAVEGPVLGERLQAVYVKASGKQRVGKQIAKKLNSVISDAVRRGVLACDNPLQVSGVKYRTYRLPGQQVRIRERGPRKLDQVPPDELAAMMRAVTHERGSHDEEEVLRGTAERLGVGRLTEQVRTHLLSVLPLARKGVEQ